MLYKAKFVMDIDKLKEDNGIPTECEITDIRVNTFGDIEFNVISDVAYENTVAVNEIAKGSEMRRVRSLGKKIELGDRDTQSYHLDDFQMSFLMRATGLNEEDLKYAKPECLPVIFEELLRLKNKAYR